MYIEHENSNILNLKTIYFSACQRRLFEPPLLVSSDAPEKFKVNRIFLVVS